MTIVSGFCYLSESVLFRLIGRILSRAFRLLRHASPPRSCDRLDGDHMAAVVNINEDGSTHVAVYRKPTHTDQYSKEGDGTRPRRPEDQSVQTMDVQLEVPRPKQQQSTTPTGTRPIINVGLPYMQGTSEALARVFKAHGWALSIVPLTPFDPSWYILRTEHLKCGLVY